jgi:hypothetical protein
MARQLHEHPSTQSTAERRASEDRRRRTLNALLHGSLKPRRYDPRRDSDAGFAAVDWHQSRWLAVALLIVILSCIDAFLTVRLLFDGAYEANPVMATLLEAGLNVFVLAKISLTSLGVILLTALARARAFGRMPVGFVLYSMLLGYATLVAYEYWLCDHHLLGP